jgi:hypothetical protein
MVRMSKGMPAERQMIRISLEESDGAEVLGGVKTVPFGDKTTTYVLTPRTEAPTLINPPLNPLEALDASSDNVACSSVVVVAVAVVDEFKAGAGDVSTASTIADPFLTPTIFNLPGSIFKKAHTLVINVVTPSLLKKSITGMLNLAVSFT